VYICVKFSSRDLNPSSYPLHSISTYTYEVLTIASRVHGNVFIVFDFEQLVTYYLICH